MKRVKIKYLVLPFFIVLLLLVTSCFAIDISPPPPSSPPQEPAPTEPGWTLPPVVSDAPLLPDFVPVVNKVKPSVVAISTVTYDIFNQPHEGAGSGWIIDEDGYVVTNNHVVEGAELITVTLDDGRAFSAGIVGTDFLADLAVVKIDAENLVKVNVGDSSKLVVGEWVLAIGNSLNLGVTPSEGIVRSLGASVPVSAGQTLYGLIGVSAPINPGNSGGPLVNMRGEVVGITTVKIAMVGVEAMGWAISSRIAMPIIEDLIQNGYVIRPWFGVLIHPRYVEGALIVQVSPDSPAGKAGIKPDDVIVGFDGKEIRNAEDLIQAIHSSQIGQRVEITVWRDNIKETTYATLMETPPPPP